MMELEHRTDFEQVRSRWDAFWDDKFTARPLVGIITPKPGVVPVDPPPYMAGAEGDYEPVIQRVLDSVGSFEYLGEAVPYHCFEFAPDHFTLLLGQSQRVHNPDSGPTAWIAPFVDDWDQVPLAFDRSCKWWRRTVEFAQALRAACEGRMILGGPTLVGGLDALSVMRGPERFMMDLIEQPDAVLRALERLKTAYVQIVDAMEELLGSKRWGSVTRHGLYSRGRITCNQCDCSCMISPAMFEQFASPWLEWEMGLFDAVEYHLDGPGALVHLERLCAMDKLDVVQWVSGAGWGEQQDWSDLFRRIDSLGKGMWLGGEDPRRVMEFWREFRTSKLCFRARVQTRQEAERLLADMEKTTRRRG
jgi:5-methyltetrahydrofolate--homocysteine methyltransferase